MPTLASPRSSPTSSSTRRHADDLVFYAALGIILGGRIGYVLFYNLTYYLQNPVDILKLWDGGMSLHGGVIGVLIAIWYVTRKEKLSFLRFCDYVACVVPFGLFLVPLGAAVLAAGANLYAWEFRRHAIDASQVYASHGFFSPTRQIATRLKLHSVEIAQGPLARWREAGRISAVRINPFDTCGHEDLTAVMAARPQVVMMSKVQSRDEMIELDRHITRLEAQHGIAPGVAQMIDSLGQHLVAGFGERTTVIHRLG